MKVKREMRENTGISSGNALLPPLRLAERGEEGRNSDGKDRKRLKNRLKSANSSCPGFIRFGGNYQTGKERGHTPTFDFMACSKVGKERGHR